MKTPVLAVTLGDPAGVGPEIVLKAWAALKESGPAFLVVGDAQALAAGIPRGPVKTIASPEEAAAAFAEALPVLDIPSPPR